VNTEVIAIADEILKGIVINSNSTFISAALGKIGLKVHRHTVFPDQPHTLKQGFTEALTRSDLVICTGGLGPTLDDLTRGVAADLFSSGFVFNQDIAEDLVRRYGPSLISL
jgi:nicotinamide-nucleotide amidase